MKSKAEIADALKKCNDLVNHCSECPYNNNNSSEECIGELLNDTIILLNKSDFEVVEEVLTRSKNQDWFGIGYQGGGYELERLDNVETPPIMFDGEGNIL